MNINRALEWNENFLSFGGSRAHGVSFLRLALLATDADGRAAADQVWPDTRYDTFLEGFVTSRTGTRVRCDEVCGREVARVVALYPLFAALYQATLEPWVPLVIEATEVELKRREKLWNAYHFGGGDQRTQLY